MATYTPEQWRELLRLDTLEDREGLPRGTLTAVMRAESGGKSTVVSPRGAGGLFQLMPATASAYKADRFDPPQAADAAARELGSHYKRYGGDMPQTLAAWNWGSGNLAKHGMENAPAETKGFIPRVLKWMSPASAEAAEPPKRQAPATNWWDEPVVPTGTAPAAAPAGNWWETPVITPQAAQEPPAAATGPQMPPVEQTPPAASPGPPGASSALPSPPTARSTPEQDAAYRAWAVQQAPGGTPPAARPQTPAAPPTAPATRQGPPAASGEPPSDMVIDITGPPEDEAPAAPTAPREDLSQLIEPIGKRSLPTMSEQLAAYERGEQPNDERPWYQRMYEDWRQGFRERAMQSGADPASPHHQRWLQSSPMPSLRTAVREIAATGLETGAGVIGTVAGARRGGPAGAVSGGVAGQSYGRRLTNQLGLRQEEAPVATIAPGVKVYPSDLANAAFGAIPALPQLAKQALRNTMAGKAILAADDALRTAQTAWKQSRDKALAAQKAGNQQAYEDALLKDRVNYAAYRKKQAARDETIKANQATYDAAVQKRADTIQTNQQADRARWRQELRQDIQQDLDWSRRANQAQERRYAQASQDVQQQQRDALAKEAQREWAEEGQEWSIHKAKDIAERYLPKEPSWKLYDRLDKQATAPDPVTGKPVDVAVPAPKSALQELQSGWTKGIDGAPAPLPPAVQQEVDAILQGSDEATFMGIRNTMKRLGPLTRSKDSEVRRASKQVFGVLGEALEQHPQASNTLKYANKNWQKETLLGDMREWLEPGGGLVFYDDAGREVIRLGGDTGLLTRVEKQMRTNPMWKRAFTERQMQNLRNEVWQIAGETKMPPVAGPTARPELLPGATVNVPNTEEFAIPKPPTSRGLSAPTPEPRPLPSGPKKPPAEPTRPPGVPVQTQYADIEPAPTRQVPTSLEKPPGFWHEVRGAGAWGGLAFSLQRMGLAPGIIDNGLYAAAAGTAMRLGSQRANYLLSQALLNPKYRSLNKHFLTMMDNGQAVVDPKLYNVMLAILTPEEKRAMERDTREPQKARR